MNYLLYGEEEFLINKEVDNIIKSLDINSLSVERYDLTLDNLNNVIDDCQTISLFEDKKVIIINNCNYFNRVKNVESDVNLLLDYLTHFNPATILIIISHNASIDNTKKITKKIKEVGTVIELNSTNIHSLVKIMFDDYKITDSNIDLLINRVGEDIAIINQEVDKLKCYKYQEKEITKEDILSCATFNIDTDIFRFIDNIINKKKDMALQMFYELLKNNEEPIKIIALLASKFRLMYQATYLSKMGINNNEIASILGVHAYPVKLAQQAGIRYSMKTILRLLKKLADLDNDIKVGNINPQLGLELFIMNV